jgi:hypothetical protein
MKLYLKPSLQVEMAAALQTKLIETILHFVTRLTGRYLAMGVAVLQSFTDVVQWWIERKDVLLAH